MKPLLNHTAHKLKALPLKIRGGLLLFFFSLSTGQAQSTFFVLHVQGKVEAVETGKVLVTGNKVTGSTQMGSGTTFSILSFELSTVA